MKKVMSIVLCLVICGALLAGCGNSTTAQNGDGGTKENEAFDVVLTIPKDFVGNATQEELDETAKEKGFESITLNSDGSATYVMTKSQHEAIVKETADNIRKSLQEMVSSEDYPNVTSVTANDDFTRFTITTKNTTPDMTESFAAMSMYMYGGMYAVFSGQEAGTIYVDYVNASTGSVIRSVNSSSMGN